MNKTAEQGTFCHQYPSSGFKHGDSVVFCQKTWDARLEISDCGNDDICKIGRGPHTVALKKFDKEGHPVIVLQGHENLAPFFEVMFELAR